MQWKQGMRVYFLKGVLKMKYFCRVIVSSAVLLFACHVFATSQKNIKCPPISVVKQSMFSQAIYKHFIGWDLTSNIFEYQGKEWNTMFGLANIDDAKNPSQALKKGRKIFKSLVLHTPKQRNEGNVTLCTYLFTDQYMVVTENPPFNMY